jgi:hypothetical protein
LVDDFPSPLLSLQVSMIGNNGFNGLNDFMMMGGDYERHEGIPHPPRVGTGWIQCHRVGQVHLAHTTHSTYSRNVLFEILVPVLCRTW